MTETETGDGRSRVARRASLRHVIGATIPSQLRRNQCHPCPGAISCSPLPVSPQRLRHRVSLSHRLPLLPPQRVRSSYRRSPIRQRRWNRTSTPRRWKSITTGIIRPSSPISTISPRTMRRSPTSRSPRSSAISAACRRRSAPPCAIAWVASQPHDVLGNHGTERRQARRRSAGRD